MKTGEGMILNCTWELQQRYAMSMKKGPVQGQIQNMLKDNYRSLAQSTKESFDKGKHAAAR
eukprot:1534974-Karenia_brevis.AAC.1